MFKKENNENPKEAFVETGRGQLPRVILLNRKIDQIDLNLYFHEKRSWCRLTLKCTT
jgi:hypothetical protein